MHWFVNKEKKQKKSVKEDVHPQDNIVGMMETKYVDYLNQLERLKNLEEQTNSNHNKILALMILLQDLQKIIQAAKKGNQVELMNQFNERIKVKSVSGGREEKMMSLLLSMNEKYSNDKNMKINKYLLQDIYNNITFLFEDSEILLVNDQKNLLINWINETASNIPKSKTKLLYRASRDGFGSRTFHEQCDNKLFTVSLIKANGYIFGGFTTQSWNVILGNPYKTDSQAFIFSIFNPFDIPSKFTIKHPTEAICCYDFLGPSFGDRDILIKDDSDLGIKNVTVLDSSYKGCPFKEGSEECTKFLCGSRMFQVEEIEVYQLQ